MMTLKSVKEQVVHSLFMGIFPGDAWWNWWSLGEFLADFTQFVPMKNPGSWIWLLLIPSQMSHVINVKSWILRAPGWFGTKPKKGHFRQPKDFKRLQASCHFKTRFQLSQVDHKQSDLNIVLSEPYLLGRKLCGYLVWDPDRSTVYNISLWIQIPS